MDIETAYYYLERSYKDNRLSHAYILDGNPRQGGEVLAKKLLKLLYCKGPDAPCESCDFCKRDHLFQHPDVHVIEPAKKSRVIDVESFRDFVSVFAQTSFAGGWKVGIIFYADCLNAASANTFLKTLEEPPPRTLFLLLTDQVEHLLPTIISRAQRIMLAGDRNRLPEGEHLDTLISALCERRGSRTQAIICAERIASMLKTYYDAIEKEEKAKARAARKDDTEEDISDDIVKGRAGALYREWRQQVLNSILYWYRDQLVLLAGGDESLLCYPDRIEALREDMPRDFGESMHRLDTVDHVVTQLNRHLPEPLALAYALLGLER